MSKPPTIIYKQSVLTEAWNRNQSLYHVYWQKQEHYGVSASALLLWVALGKTMSEASLISIYLLRITVSIQYLFHSGVHWLHRYSLWWPANWAVPVASIEFENVALCSNQKWSRCWNVDFNRNGVCFTSEGICYDSPSFATNHLFDNKSENNKHS